uniref:Uncharacterized protein n=1 Tax=Anguilla anguilla TaxID=7936 RepID=A0A0E9WNJ9_ANGAN
MFWFMHFYRDDTRTQSLSLQLDPPFTYRKNVQGLKSPNGFNLTLYKKKKRNNSINTVKFSLWGGGL